MTLEEYAYLFEIIGGIIVIVTLIFLVIQLRQNTVMLKSATLINTQGHALTAFEMLVEDSMMEAMIKGMRTPSELSPVQKGKFHAYWTAALQEYQQTYFQVKSGVYDEELQDGWWQMLRNYFLSPGFQLHWEQRSFVLSSEFRDFVESNVMSRQPTPGYEAAVLAREAS